MDDKNFVGSSCWLYARGISDNIGKIFQKKNINIRFRSTDRLQRKAYQNL